MNKCMNKWATLKKNTQASLIWTCIHDTNLERLLILLLHYAYIARCVSLHNNYQIEDVLSYVVDEKVILTIELISVNFFLTSLKSLVNRLTLFAASHTSNTFSPFLFSFCSYAVVIFDKWYYLGTFLIACYNINSTLYLAHISAFNHSIIFRREIEQLRELACDWPAAAWTGLWLASR